MPRPPVAFELARALAVAALLTACWATPARGVVIISGDGSGNTSAPPDDPGWSYIGGTGSGTTVYLGNRWVLSAYHVGGNASGLPGGGFQRVRGSEVQLHNPPELGLSDKTDLVMFRLASDPGLPSLAIAASSPPIGAEVTMIGRGKLRAPEQTGWRLNRVDDEVIWTEVPLAQSDARGYKTTDVTQTRWGRNLIENDGDPDLGHTIVAPLTNLGDIVALTTKFDADAPIGYPEAQATLGDSGGGVFYRRAGQWELAGIMVAFTPSEDQPEGTVVFGNGTIIADLATYRSQIMELLASPIPYWQNGVEPLDVNDDGMIAPLDALLIINKLDAEGAHALDPPGAIGPPPFFDTNGDNVLAPLDALRVINLLDRPAGSPLAAAALDPSGMAAVPEPSSFALAIGGMVLVILALRRRR